MKVKLFKLNYSNIVHFEMHKGIHKHHISVSVFSVFNVLLFSLFGLQPCHLKDWEMHLQFKVHGSGKKNLHGDGIAFWYTKDKLHAGNVGLLTASCFFADDCWENSTSVLSIHVLLLFRKIRFTHLSSSTSASLSRLHCRLTD